MKVVEQLCDYLSARGLLSSDDEQRLQTRGFCLPGEYDHYDYDPWDYWNESDHYGYIDLEEEAAREQCLYEGIERRGQRRSSKGNRKSGRRRTKKADASQVAATVERRLGEHEDMLASLTLHCSPGDSVTTWQQAALSIVQAGGEQLATRLSESFERGDITTSRLLDLELFEPFPEQAFPPMLRRAGLMLAAGKGDSYPPSRKLLREPAIREAYHLVLAQHAVAKALGQVATASSHLIIRKRPSSVFHCRVVLVLLAAATLAHRPGHSFDLGGRFIPDSELALIQFGFWSDDDALTTSELRAMSLILTMFDLSPTVLGEMLAHRELTVWRSELPPAVLAAWAPLESRAYSKNDDEIHRDDRPEARK